ncbi:MAG: hypothetical protein ABIC82_03290 [bacterium]
MMNTSTIAEIKNNVIVLPKEIQKSWQGTKIYIDFNQDIISIKKLSKSNLAFKDMLDEFSSAARKTKLSKKEVNQVLKQIKQK